MKMIKTFSKSTLTSVVSLACGLVMYSAMKNSKPSLQNHANAVTDVVENVVDDIFQNRIVIPEQSVKMADYISNKVIPKAMDTINRVRTRMAPDERLPSGGRFTAPRPAR